MQCEACRLWMDDRLDGLLAPAEEQAVAAHVGACPACAAEWRRRTSLHAALRALPRPTMPELARARLKHRLLDEMAICARPEHVRTWVPRAAAAVVLLGVGVLIGSSLGPVAAGLRAGVEQALPHPEPELRLRDATTGGWIAAEELVRGLKHNDGAVVTVQPRLRAPLGVVKGQLERERVRVLSALVQNGIALDAVRFREPVHVSDNLLDGPEVELWVEPATPSVRTVSAAAR